MNWIRSKQIGRFAVCLVALVTTSPGLYQGLGLIGEEVTRVSISAQMVGTGDLNPYWFGHPATLLHYILAALYQFFAYFSETLDIRSLYTLDPAPLFLIGRLFSRLIAVSSSILCFEVASKVMRTRWAIGCAILLSINPLFVTHAHRARADHLLTLLLLLSTLLLINILRNNQKGFWKLAFLAGIALTFKYLAASILLSLTIAIFYFKGISKNSIISTLFMIICFFSAIILTSPYLVLDSGSALSGLLSEVAKPTIWEPQLILTKFFKILIYSFSSLGVFSLLTYVLFKLVEVSKKEINKSTFLSLKVSAIPETSLLIIYIPFITGGFFANTYNSTWLAPALPFLSITLILSIREFASIIFVNSKMFRRLFLIVIISTIIINQAIKTRSINSMRAMQGTTVEAEEWLIKNINPGDSILLLQPQNIPEAFGFPRLTKTAAQIFIVNENNEHLQVCKISANNYLANYPHTSLRHLPCYPRPVFSSKSNTSLSNLLMKYDYIITSERFSLPSEEKILANSSPNLVAEFLPPFGVVKLIYSPNPFPQGDSGVWSSIRIYKSDMSKKLDSSNRN